MAKQTTKVKVRGIPAAKLRSKLKLAKVRARIGKRKA